MIIGNNMELTFEKWEDGRWFVVLPDYDGPNPLPGTTYGSRLGKSIWGMKKGGKYVKRIFD